MLCTPGRKGFCGEFNHGLLHLPWLGSCGAGEIQQALNDVRGARFWDSPCRDAAPRVGLCHGPRPSVLPQLPCVGQRPLAALAYDFLCRLQSRACFGQPRVSLYFATGTAVLRTLFVTLPASLEPELSSARGWMGERGSL